MFSLRVFHDNRIDELCDFFTFNEANHLASCLNNAIISCIGFPDDDFPGFDPPFYFFIEKLTGGASDEG